MTSTSHSMSVSHSGLLALTVSVALLRGVALSAQIVPAVDQSVLGTGPATVVCVLLTSDLSLPLPRDRRSASIRVPSIDNDKTRMKWARKRAT
jgi:hypothetical protein